MSTKLKEEEDQDLIYEKIKNSTFKQQRLAAWRPFPTFLSTLIGYAFFGIVFIIIGVILLVYSNKVKEIKTDYTDLKLDEQGTITITINEDMDGPVMVYYKIIGFFQNHRRFLASKSTDQLQGTDINLEDMQSNENCKPVYTNEEMGKTVNVNGDQLNPKDLAIPCGLLAKSYFTDEFVKFELYDSNGNAKDITFSDKDIAYNADKYFYKNVDISKQWVDMTNEHFMVWMRPGAFPDVKKLYGRIYTDLKKDDVLKITIENNYNVTYYEGKKEIILNNPNKLGGKNNFLACSYIIVGVLCIIFDIVYFILEINEKKGEDKRQ